MLQLAKLAFLSVFVPPFAAAAQIPARDLPLSAGFSDPIFFPGLGRGDFLGNHNLLQIRDSIYGTRNVSYFVVNGLAIIDGDVIYGSVNQLRLQDIRRSPQIKENRALSVNSNSAWPSATITYRYESDTTATVLIPIVNAAIARWKVSAPYLTFNRLLPNSNVEANGAAIIRATQCGGCNSHIGFANAPRVMNLQQSCPSNPGSCGVNEATHEFGHLLGLYHEHQRPARDWAVRFQCQNVNPSCPSGVWMLTGRTCCNTGLPAGCCSNVANFDVIHSPSVDSTGPYDITSLMHYRSNAFAIPGTNTLVAAAPGIVVPATNPAMPSALDFSRICKIYDKRCRKAAECKAAGCPTHCTTTKQCNKPSLCLVDDPPPCCHAFDVNEVCLAKRAQCSSMGCDFLK